MNSEINSLERLKILLRQRKEQFDAENAELVEEIKAKEDAIKAKLIDRGGTIISRSGMLTATLTKPRETWNTKALNALAETDPSLMKLKKTGKPYVRFTLKKEAKTTSENQDWN